jgi:predicted DNA-binding protein
MTFAIDADIERRLEALGADSEASKAALLRKAVLEGLEDLEDLRLVEERLSRPEREYSLEEVEREFGLVD